MKPRTAADLYVRAHNPMSYLALSCPSSQTSATVRIGRLGIRGRLHRPVPHLRSADFQAVCRASHGRAAQVHGPVDGKASATERATTKKRVVGVGGSFRPHPVIDDRKKGARCGAWALAQLNAVKGCCSLGKSSGGCRRVAEPSGFGLACAHFKAVRSNSTVNRTPRDEAAGRRLLPRSASPRQPSLVIQPGAMPFCPESSPTSEASFPL